MVSGSLALLYFLLGFHGGRQGSGPDRGRSPVEWGDFPSVRTSVRTSIHPFPPLNHPARPEAQPASQPSLRLQGWLAGPQAWLAGPQAWLDGPEGGTDGWMDKCTDEQTENLPILEDFVPYRCRCPVTAQLQPKNYIKQGKGTADHMMPLAMRLVLFFLVLPSSLPLFLPFPLLFFPSFSSQSLFLFLGSGPDRGRSPVE